MTINQDLLDQEMGTLPPSTVDVDALIARQHRRVRLRQAGIAAGACAVLLAFALVPTVLPRTSGAPLHPGASAAATPGSTPTPSAREAEAARLTGVLHTLLATALPQAQFVSYPGTERPAGASLVFGDQTSHFAATAAIVDSAGTGGIYVSVGREDTLFRETGGCLTDPKPLDVQVFDCTVQPTAAGNVMVVTMQSGNFKRFYVEVMRGDGNSVGVDVRNSTTGPPDAQRADPPLTKDQTIALAENPDLATTLP